MGNGLLWQAEFLGWQTVLFSLLVPLSVPIEIFCHGPEGDAKQCCWPPCMCLSLSTLILVGQSGDVRNQRWKERELDLKKKKKVMGGCFGLTINHPSPWSELKKTPKNPNLFTSHHSYLSGETWQVRFLFLIFFMTDSLFKLLASLIQLHHIQAPGGVHLNQLVRASSPVVDTVMSSQTYWPFSTRITAILMHFK